MTNNRIYVDIKGKDNHTRLPAVQAMALMDASSMIESVLANAVKSGIGITQNTYGEINSLLLDALFAENSLRIADGLIKKDDDATAATERVKAKYKGMLDARENGLL